MDALESLNIESALAAQAEQAAAEDEVGQNDFLTMLVAQLENQDPLNPQDSADFAAQLAQFSSVEQLVAVRTGIDQLVANSTPGAEVGAATAATRVDPTNLVGQEVTVFGSQIEVDENRSQVTMDFRSIEEATEATVILRNENGTEVYREALIVQEEGELQTSLRPGDHTYVFDPAARNFPPGVYAIEFQARNAAGDPVTLLPTITGQVTGAILAGEPSIRMGNRIFSVDDVLEVGLPGTTGNAGPGGSGSAFGAAAVLNARTGGGQQVVRPQPGLTPTPGNGVAAGDGDGQTTLSPNFTRAPQRTGA